jgi:hypothetical protein
VFTGVRYWSLSRCIQSTNSYPISLRFILIVSSYLRLHLLSGLFRSYSDIFYMPSSLKRRNKIESKSKERSREKMEM